MFIGRTIGLWELDYPFGLAWVEFVAGLGLLFYLFVDSPRRGRIPQVVLRIIVVLVGTLLLVPVGAFFNAMRWPLLNTWALAHGVFIVFLPVLLFILFRIANFLSRRFGRVVERRG